MGCPHQNQDFNFLSAIFAEFLGTFLVCLTFYFLFDVQKAGRFALAIGFSVGISIFMIGEITGGAVNMFRYLGPALLSLKLADSYIYIVGGLLGGVTAAFLYQNVFEDRKKEKASQREVIDSMSRSEIVNDN